jgi:hypothetical protein
MQPMAYICRRAASLAKQMMLIGLKTNIPTIGAKNTILLNYSFTNKIFSKNM